MTLEQAIVAEAKNLGFDAVCFVPAGPSTTMALFDQWIESGYAASMDYLSRSRRLRADARNIESRARSIIVVSARYPTNPEPGGGISFLARGRDYHKVMLERLRKLAAAIFALRPTGLVKPQVDSTPLPERELAIRAGIGWRGRQGQVISPTAGACIVLGELLVDFELQPTVPIPSQCGDCRLCIEACPTHAILPSGLVDARRCVSYLTVEYKGDFTPEMRSMIGTSLFGCDRCTAVCPWNQKATTPTLQGLEPMPIPSPGEILQMSNADFRRRFDETSIRRLGLSRLQRNALAALHNQRHLQNMPDEP